MSQRQQPVPDSASGLPVQQLSHGGVAAVEGRVHHVVPAQVGGLRGGLGTQQKAWFGQDWGLGFKLRVCLVGV
jgi:hypothetical protein